MKKLVLAASWLLAAASFAHGMEPSSGVFPLPLKEHLELSDAQISGFMQVNGDYRDLIAAQEARSGQLQVEVARENGREHPDPAALGARYAALEALRRERLAATNRHRDRLRALLTDTQRAKLKALEEATRLQPLIGAAQCDNLLAAAPDRPCAPTAPGRRMTPHLQPVEPAPVR